MMASDTTPVSIVYKNWRGETNKRRIVPNRLWFGANQWHLMPQWFIEAYDIDKGAMRMFALADIETWPNP